MSSDNKIPREMLGDIILTFLLGIKTEHIDSRGVRIPDEVRSLHHSSYASWKDIFSLRKAVVNKMSGTDIKEVRKLAKALKKVWKL